MDQRYRLTTTPDDLGLRCTTAGLTLAGVALLHKGQYGFAPRPSAELRALLAQAYPALDRDLEPGLEVVAQALNAGDLTKAMIAAVFLRLPPLDLDAAERLTRTEDGLAKAYNPAEDRDARGRWTVSGLLATAQRATGVDTRQLATQLAQSRREISPAAFQSLSQGVEARLSQADRKRLAQDRDLEAKIDSLTRPYYASPLAQQAAAKAIRIQQTGHGLLSPEAVQQTLHAIHVALEDRAAGDVDRLHLLALYYDVQSRGVEQGLLGTNLSRELVEYGVAAMAYDGGGAGEHPSRPVPLGDAKLVGTTSPTIRYREIREDEMLGLARTKNYRNNFYEANPHITRAADIHHSVPQHALTDSPDDFSYWEIHSPQNLKAIRRELVGYVHRSITERDKQFRAANPKPTREQRLIQARKMDRMYGEFFEKLRKKYYRKHHTYTQ
jgi:hypothetical protein